MRNEINMPLSKKILSVALGGLAMFAASYASAEDDLYQKAVAEEKSGEYADSIADISKLLQAEPDNAKAYNVRAAAYSNVGKRDLARADLTVAIQLKPDNAGYRFARGLEWDSNDFDRVVEDFDAAIRLSPNDAELRDDIANAWLRRKQFDRADENYEAAIKLKPNDAGLYFDRAFGLHIAGKDDEAMDLYDTSIRLNPDNKEAYVFRGFALIKLKKLDEAEADFSKALSLNPSDADTFAERGAVRGLRHDYAGALEDFSKGIDLDPAKGDYCGRALTYKALNDYASASKDIDTADSLKMKPCASWLSDEVRAHVH